MLDGLSLLGAGTSELQFGEWQANSQILFLAKLVAEFHDQLCRRCAGIESRVEEFLIGQWVLAEVNRLRSVTCPLPLARCPNEILIHPLGQEWNERGQGFAQCHQDFVQRLVGRELVRIPAVNKSLIPRLLPLDLPRSPEAAAVAADVPVREVVQEIFGGFAERGRVEVGHLVLSHFQHRL